MKFNNNQIGNYKEEESSDSLIDSFINRQIMEEEEEKTDSLLRYEIDSNYIDYETTIKSNICKKDEEKEKLEEIKEDFTSTKKAKTVENQTPQTVNNFVNFNQYNPSSSNLTNNLEYFQPSNNHNNYQYHQYLYQNTYGQQNNIGYYGQRVPINQFYQGVNPHQITPPPYYNNLTYYQPSQINFIPYTVQPIQPVIQPIQTIPPTYNVIDRPVMNVTYPPNHHVHFNSYSPQMNNDKINQEIYYQKQEISKKNSIKSEPNKIVIFAQENKLVKEANKRYSENTHELHSPQKALKKDKKVKDKNKEKEKVKEKEREKYAFTKDDLSLIKKFTSLLETPLNAYSKKDKKEKDILLKQNKETIIQYELLVPRLLENFIQNSENKIINQAFRLSISNCSEFVVKEIVEAINKNFIDSCLHKNCSKIVQNLIETQNIDYLTKIEKKLIQNTLELSQNINGIHVLIKFLSLNTDLNNIIVDIICSNIIQISRVLEGSCMIQKIISSFKIHDNIKYKVMDALVKNTNDIIIGKYSVFTLLKIVFIRDTSRIAEIFKNIFVHNKVQEIFENSSICDFLEKVSLYFLFYFIVLRL